MDDSTCPRHGEVEQWLPVVGFEGFYEVSGLGRVRSVPRVILTRTGQTRRLQGKVLSPGHTKPVDGYPFVNLSKDGVDHLRLVHRLVAAAFIGPCPEGMEVRHKTLGTTNCAATNLEYGTSGDNKRDQVRDGTHPEASKTQCDNGHEFTKSNTYNRPNGGRGCKICIQARSHESYLRRRDRERAERNGNKTAA